MDGRNPMLRNARKKNHEISFMYITTYTTWIQKNHLGKGASINKFIMEQLGTIKETNREEHGGIILVHKDIIVSYPRAIEI